MSELCQQCKASGLPILPVRYAVVPASVKPGLPGWASASRVGEIDVGPDYHYALRTLGAGYLYLFFDRNPYGRNKWECYSVAEDGGLVRQDDPLLALPPAAQVRCTRQGHSPFLTHYLVIERPDKCGQAWIAYSEHKWSKETLARYASDPALRGARMQSFDVAALAGACAHPHATPVSEEALQSIIEYAPEFNTASLPYDVAAGPISEEDGRFKPYALRTQATLHPWHLRNTIRAEAARSMAQRARRSDGGANTPQVFVLWDAIGIAHELNGFRNGAAGRIEQYLQERELQLSCEQYLDTLRQTVADATETQIEHQQALAFDITTGLHTVSSTGLHRLAAGRPNDPRYPEAAALLAEWEQAAVPSRYGQRLLILLERYAPSLWREEVDRLKAEVDTLIARRDSARQAYRAEARAQSWRRYEKYLDTEGALKTFRHNRQRFLEAAERLIEAPTLALIRWLEAPLFLDTLEDCHPDSIRDGLLFEDRVGQALHGIGSSPAGARKLDAWAADTRGPVRENLLWRVITLNQNAARADIEVALLLAEIARSERTVADALNLTANLAKIGQALFSVHKSAAAIMQANARAGSLIGMSAFGARIRPIRSYGIDSTLTAIGDAILRHFRINDLSDYLCEKIMQHMLSARALIDPEDSRSLILLQAADEPRARAQLVRRLASGNAFLTQASAEMRAAQSERLKAAWASVRAGGSDALRAPRIAALMILVEGFNFNKLLYESARNGDLKSWTTLAASAMTLTSGLIDIVAVPVKEELARLGDTGAASWSMQRLKLAGGLLSAGAATIGVVWDSKSAVELWDKQYNLSRLYGFKALLGGTGAALTLASTFSHAAPLLGRLARGEALQGAAEAVGARASAVIGARILFMSVGAWIGLGTFALQVVIWVQPDELQQWCERCAFGTQRDTRWNAKHQYTELEKAMTAIGLV